MPFDCIDLQRTAPGRFRLNCARPLPAGASLQLFVADAPHRFDRTRPAVERVQGPLELDLGHLQPHQRPYFLLRDAQGREQVLAEQRLPLPGSPNFRDLGGYAGRAGRPLVWGKLFRSGRLSRLSEVEQALVQGLALDLVFDFRQQGERERDPSRWAEGDGPRVEALEVVPGNAEHCFSRAAEGVATAEEMAEFMRALNRDLALSQQAAYRRMFRHILDTPDARVLMHCTAGKDRTGFGVALLLSALGVSREQVMHDYLLTNRYLPVDDDLAAAIGHFAAARGAVLSAEVLRPVFEVRPEYLQSALQAVEAEAGSMDAYLEGAMGLGASEREELARRYLQS